MLDKLLSYIGPGHSVSIYRTENAKGLAIISGTDKTIVGWSYDGNFDEAVLDYIYEFNKAIGF